MEEGEIISGEILNLVHLDGTTDLHQKEDEKKSRTREGRDCARCWWIVARRGATHWGEGRGGVEKGTPGPHKGVRGDRYR